MAKKNFVRDSFTNKVNREVGFTWPKAHNGKKIFVDFYVFDPATGEKKRIKKHFDSVKKKREREEAIRHYIHTMSRRLMDGWNPFVECGDKGLTTLDKIFDKYEISLSHYSRKKTESNYKSRLSILKSFISELPFPPKYAYQLTKEFFVDFLDWLSDDRECAPRTRNNYKGWCSSLCEWLVQRGYLPVNDIAKIPKLQEGEKTRKALTSPEVKQLFKYLTEHNRHFLLACMFEYYTMIRPTELSYLKIGDIDLKNQCIYVSGEFSKNRRDGAVSINRRLVMTMLDLDIFSYPSDCYLFGSGFKPSVERLGPDQFNKKFVQVRKKLKFPDSYKFYSLKDSGIRDLANEKGIVVARDQARHTDISTTNRYLQGRDLRGPSGAKDFDGAFPVD